MSEHVTITFMVIAAGMACFTMATVWSRRETRVRLMVVVSLLLWMLALPVSALNVLGWPKPMWAAWEMGGERVVLGSKLVLGEAIYLYLDNGSGQPRSMMLPWSDELAQQLQDALRESSRRGQSGAIMKFEPSWDMNPPQFHPMPQPVIPLPKGTPPAPAILDREA